MKTLSVRCPPLPVDVSSSEKYKCGTGEKVRAGDPILRNWKVVLVC